MPRNNNFRRINHALGKQASLGPLPADLLIPFLVSAILAYLGYAFLGLTLIQALFLASFLLSTWWLTTGGNAFRFFSRFSRWFLPRWYRGSRRYHSRLNATHKDDYPETKP